MQLMTRRSRPFCWGLAWAQHLGRAQKQIRSMGDSLTLVALMEKRRALCVLAASQSALNI